MIGIGEPFVYTRITPRSNVIIPRVEINGGIPQTDTKNPFTAPQAIPTVRDTATATAVLPVDASTPEASTPDNPRIEPTERSIPPVKITNVIPHPTIPATVICLKTLNRFVTLKKLGDKIVANTQITRRINTER